MACPGPKKSISRSVQLSKGEICSNYSLSICLRFLQPFTALPEGRALQALRSQTFSSSTSRGPAIDVFTLMVGAPGPSAPAPPRDPSSTFSR
jgi:hypothetical protein